VAAIDFNFLANKYVRWLSINVDIAADLINCGDAKKNNHNRV
jgi:hypothetical protein